ncbi:hypothetical protein LF95_08770 [Thalassospira sp. TSL5-1]|nr:hypothetical protein LF95_08770 [Thalassospira sp. TSL5-1]
MVMAYVTVPDMDCARKIARSALGARLAACANILPSMTSVYEWNGEVEEASETVLLLKTEKQIFSKLQAHVLDIHPYDTPCVLEVPLGRINDGYAAWLHQQVS